MNILLGGSRLLSPELVAACGGLLPGFRYQWPNAVYHLGDAKGADRAFALELSRRGMPFILYAVNDAGSVIGWGNPMAVVSYAGGPAYIPYRARLAQRSKAAADGAEQGHFVISHSESKGSLNTAAYMYKQGKSVIVWTPLSVRPAPLPGIAGHWMDAGVSIGIIRAWIYHQKQLDLFNPKGGKK